MSTCSTRKAVPRRNTILIVVMAALVAACADQSTPTPEAPAAHELCSAAVTAIPEIQGSRFASPITGQVATIRGVVTLTGPQGAYVQEAQVRPERDASHALFVASPELASSVEAGALVTASGTVEELGEGADTLTALSAPIQFADCGEGPELPDFDARLPLNATDREAYEGMRLSLSQPLTVTAVRDLPEGEIIVNARGLMRAPTEVALPGEDARTYEQRNHDWSLTVYNEALRSLDPYTEMSAGTLINDLSGVLGHDGRGLALFTPGSLDFVSSPAPVLPPAKPGTIRAAGFNLYGYFNGDGQGGGFPGERGAESIEAFNRQVERIATTIMQIQPDVLAVMEVENDGFGPDSAIQHLAELLTRVLGPEYAVAVPVSERAGSDVISVGLVYRSDRLEAVGPAAILEGGVFDGLNRAPLAQVLRDRDSGEAFVAVANHLKSKGGCPDSGPDAYQDDGQACWNQARTQGAVQTVQWATGLASAAGTAHVLLLGDFNAYRLEDPVRAIRDQGMVELVEAAQPGMHQYSFIYRGAAGTLDYAFASDSLAQLTSRALIWNINAAYPLSTRPSEPWLRSSDHDPVVVDFRLIQPATSD